MLRAPTGKGQTRRSQRRPCVVGHLARPHEIPQRLAQRLGRVIELGEQVGEEARTVGEARAQLVDLRSIVLGAHRGECARSARRRADRGGVLPEVQRHAPGASERAGANPHQLAARAQTVQPRLRVGARAAWQHVALPDPDGKREALQRNEHLAQAVDAGARAGVAVDALPGGQERRQAALVDRLDLLAQGGQGSAPEATKDVHVAPLAAARRRPGVPPGRSSPRTISPARSSSRSTALASTP